MENEGIYEILRVSVAMGFAPITNPGRCPFAVHRQVRYSAAGMNVFDLQAVSGPRPYLQAFLDATKARASRVRT